MKEYHLHKTPLPDGAEQIFITSAVRDEEDQTITVEEIFVITCIGDKEVKARIDVQNLINKIVLTPGGNIPTANFDKMYELLDPVTPEKVQLQNQVDLYQHEFNPADPITDDLIFAADMAAACHAIDFETVIEELLNADPTCKR
jgi:hypothetical protein